MTIRWLAHNSPWRGVGPRLEVFQLTEGERYHPQNEIIVVVVVVVEGAHFVVRGIQKRRSCESKAPGEFCKIRLLRSQDYAHRFVSKKSNTNHRFLLKSIACMMGKHGSNSRNRTSVPET